MIFPRILDGMVAASASTTEGPLMAETSPSFKGSAFIERCPDTGLYIGFIPGFTGAHSQAQSLDELQRNLQEVVSMLLEAK